MLINALFNCTKMYIIFYYDYEFVGFKNFFYSKYYDSLVNYRRVSVVYRLKVSCKYHFSKYLALRFCGSLAVNRFSIPKKLTLFIGWKTCILIRQTFFFFRLCHLGRKRIQALNHRFRNKPLDLVKSGKRLQHP